MKTGIYAIYYASFRSKSVRVYSRTTTASGVGAIPKELKTALKAIGFTWDKCNHSYELCDPTESAITEIEQLMPLERR